MKKHPWNKLSLVTKLVLQIAVISVLLFGMNMLFYIRLDTSMQRLDSVYSSNVDVTQLSDSIAAVQNNMYLYLKVKSSDSLRDYYQSEARYRELLDNLNEENINSPTLILEKNIRRMSESYLELTAETVAAKRARNVEKYKEKYEESQQLYDYITSEITQLNQHLFITNNQHYETLRELLKYLETSNVILMLVIVACGIVFISVSTRGMVRPLARMADTARLVGEGNFNMKMPETGSEDELGAVTHAFNTMVESLGEYMERTRQSMEKEQKLMERELLMETHLKEAQLRFLQAQINPHFLFNSLNAGVQLAMLEDAEKTGIFLEKMADFFRYNVKKGQEAATLREELEAVDNYVYILNVRFTGDIHLSEYVEEGLEEVRLPSMILQPIVENAVNHGIRDIDREGRIYLWVKRKGDQVEIGIRDNGKGMTQERIQKVLRGEAGEKKSQHDSTGIGLHNVITRVELYYQKKNLLQIYSEGENKGTEVILTVPSKSEE